ncbi:MAG: acyl-CoA dehydrogenase, partial [Betaproteobacteria bacterium]
MSDARIDDELRLLADSVAAFTRTDTGLARMRKLRGARPGFERDGWLALSRMGWTGILIPERFGGAGLGFAHTRVVAEGLARVLAPEPFTASAVLATRALIHGSNDELKARELPRLAAGETIACLAWQEAPDDRPLSDIETVARSEGDALVLTGTKRFVTPADDVDAYVVSARAHDRMLLAWVPSAAARLSSEVQARSDGSFCQSLRLDGVRIPASSVIASGEAAETALARAIDEANVMVSAELFGIMDQAL